MHGIPNAQVLLSPLFSHEAVLSSRIEGTQATLGEVLEFEAAADTASADKRDDILEVLNYRKAMLYAVDALKRLPLSLRVIRETHRELMAGVRGRDKTPGEYRRTANWIGPPGAGIEAARFIPPGANHVEPLLSHWERYLHEQVQDTLVQLAILHAEFEAIHPFLDGNGRLGRLLVPLFLVHKQLLGSPSFYVSAFFEAQRDQYYERLLAVSRDDDWTGWCVFFLGAMTAQARQNEVKAKAIFDLYARRKSWIQQQTHSQYAVQALDWFFARPVFTTSDFVASARIPKPTASRMVREVRDAGVLMELRPSRGRTPAILFFPELLNIAEGRAVF